ncbi:small integral membrane protein 26 [Nycticebus coucang]|uniref:small integral membrane protein 26 n=1 Tax=Nycticebus coucang TaxID=9470 RepID=UPI00234D4F45|nr:small integral membrane protein 26 [Nycticebus coucang]
MHPARASAWYRRMSVVYALGTWTLLSSVFVLSRRKQNLPGNEENQKNDSTHELIEPLPEFYVETIVTYKEDFVPVTERILNYLKSWTDGPGPES